MTNIPSDADASSFSGVCGDGDQYSLYLRQLGNPNLLYQFSWVPGSKSYQWGYGNAIPKITVAGFPTDTDWSRWSMLNDGDYRIYAFKQGSNTEFYQGAWNGNAYEYGYDSIKVLSLSDAPANTNFNSVAMLHDGSDYRLYMQTV